MKHLKHNSAEFILVVALVLAIALCVSTTLAQQPPSIAIVVNDSLTLTVSREEALELFHLYERHEVTHPEDVEMYQALQMALWAGGKKELVYGEGDETWAARKLREWQSKGE